MRFYRGVRLVGGNRVLVAENDDAASARPLPNYPLFGDFPAGIYTWGDDDSVSYRLALALIWDATEDQRLALGFAVLFRRIVVRNLPLRSWVMTEEDIRRRVAQIEADDFRLCSGDEGGGIA